jgi:disulfide bond formation protein DsbB
VPWRFLGLAMPAWVLICTLVLGVLGVTANASASQVARGGTTRRLTA